MPFDIKASTTGKKPSPPRQYENNTTGAIGDPLHTLLCRNFPHDTNNALILKKLFALDLPLPKTKRFEADMFETARGVKDAELDFLDKLKKTCVVFEPIPSSPGQGGGTRLSIEPTSLQAFLEANKGFLTKMKKFMTSLSADAKYAGLAQVAKDWARLDNVVLNMETITGLENLLQGLRDREFDAAPTPHANDVKRQSVLQPTGIRK